MLQAILAGIVTLIAVLVAAVVLLRRHRTQRDDTVETSHSVESMIETFGVEPQRQQTGFGQHGPVTAPDTPTPSGNVGEALENRFVAMGVVAAAVFGSLAAKLWSMQVLASESYTQAAEQNLFSTVYTPAPRGIIYDRDGNVLVDNRTAYTVLATSDVADNADVVRRLSTLLGMPAGVVRKNIQDASTGAQNNRIVTSDATMRNVAFISEHSSAFPGITCEMRTIRTYPYGAFAAHVLGYTGKPTDADLLESASGNTGRNVQSFDVVGQAGVEGAYENLLAGDHGTQTLLTDANGTVRDIVSETSPERGNDLFLTLRGPVQQVAEAQLRAVVAPDGVIGATGAIGSGAGVVCLDVSNGEILAMASYPSFTPESFVGGIPTDVWNSFNDPDSHYPLMNRVIQGAYPAASTFKAFTGMAALTDGIATSASSYNCTGVWTGFGEDYAQKCWRDGGHGELDLQGGIANSCDTVFYEIAKGFFYAENLPETAMQDYICEYGFGAATGIDLFAEAQGRIPTPAWKEEAFRDAPEERMWVGGDMSNMVIGQGYVLVTPLQIACGYAAIATGQSWRPHVLKEVHNNLGETVLEYEPQILATPTQHEADIALVRAGLCDVMTLNQYDNQFFSDFNVQVAGKTGTAQVAGKKDYSWFACYAPAEAPKYVVAVLVEEGVAANRSAMPIASRVLKAAFDYDEGKITAADMQPVGASYYVVETSDEEYVSERED